MSDPQRIHLLTDEQLMMEEVLELLAHDPDRASEETTSHAVLPSRTSDCFSGGCEDNDDSKQAKGKESTLMEDEVSTLTGPEMTIDGKDTAEATGGQYQDYTFPPESSPIAALPLQSSVSAGFGASGRLSPTPPLGFQAHGYPSHMQFPSTGVPGSLSLSQHRHAFPGPELPASFSSMTTQPPTFLHRGVTDPSLESQPSPIPTDSTASYVPVSTRAEPAAITTARALGVRELTSAEFDDWKRRLRMQVTSRRHRRRKKTEKQDQLVRLQQLEEELSQLRAIMAEAPRRSIAAMRAELAVHERDVAELTEQLREAAREELKCTVMAASLKLRHLENTRCLPES